MVVRSGPCVRDAHIVAAVQLDPWKSLKFKIQRKRQRNQPAREVVRMEVVQVLCLDKMFRGKPSIIVVRGWFVECREADGE